jgi:1-acyl-sn-glycerol-3-phosphate acyltransferase
MVSASEARVVSLQTYTRQRAAGRAHRRAADLHQHPSTPPNLAGVMPSDDASAVIREIGVAGGTARADQPHRRPGGLAGRVAAVAEFVRRRLTGDYNVDEFGFDPHFNDAIAMPMLRPVFNKWFRVDVTGIENLPDTGAALVVANHAGVLPLDALMISVAVHDKHPAHRTLRTLAADMVFDTPVLGSAARKAGHTRACVGDAHRLLSNGELAAVFPEGYKGLGKCFKDRYRLQRFGRGGFVSAALRAKAPLIPCSVIGSEEVYPMLGDLRPLARLLGLPYFPVTALFPLAGPIGLIPMPSKWHIEFGSPIPTSTFSDSAPEDAMLTFELTDQVRETIQRTIYRLLRQRRNTLLG